MSVHVYIQRGRRRERERERETNFQTRFTQPTYSQNNLPTHSNCTRTLLIRIRLSSRTNIHSHPSSPLLSLSHTHYTHTYTHTHTHMLMHACIYHILCTPLNSFPFIAPFSHTQESTLISL